MSPSQSSRDSLTVSATPDSLRKIADFVVDGAQSAGLDPHAVYRLRLACDELATNIITHGYQAESDQVPTITLHLEPHGDDGCTCVLEDNAPPFNPLAVDVTDPFREVPLEDRQEGGLGLFLVRRSVDHFHYERDGHINRNALTVRRTEPNSLGVSKEQRIRDRRGVHLAFATGQLDAWHTVWQPIKAVYAVTEIPDCRQLVRLLHVRGVGFSQRQPSSAGPPIDVVLLDWLSDDAVECLASLKRDPRTRDVWTIVLLPAGDEEDAERVFALGADDVFVAASPPSVALRRIDHAAERLRLVKERRAERRRSKDLERVADTFTEIIVPLGVRFTEESELNDLMERIVIEAMAICHADGGTLYLKSEDELTWNIIRTLSAGLAYGGPRGQPVIWEPIPLHLEDGQPNLHNLASQVALTGETVHVPDVYDEPHVDVSMAQAFDQRTGYRTVSCLTVPVEAGEQVLGVLQLLNAQNPESHQIIPFSDYHQVLVESLASQAALALHDRRLQDQRQSFIAAEQQLDIGRQIQQDFLPTRLPRLTDWEIAIRFEPAMAVSGDFYDVFPLTPDGCLGFVIADVCDKGVGASIFMALTRSLLRAFSQRGWTTLDDRPAVTGKTQKFLIVSGDVPTLSRMLRTAVGLTNDYIATTHAELNMFATVFFGLLVPDSGKFLYINAGHPAPLLIAEDGSIRHRLTRTGPAVGIIPSAEFEIGEVDIGSGEILLGYTDGVTDALQPGGDRFGRGRVEEVARTSPGYDTSAEQLLERMVDAVEHHVGGGRQYDDIAMLALRRRLSA